MNQQDRAAMVDHLNAARDKALRAHHVTPQTVALAVAEAAATWHTEILERTEMVPREAYVSEPTRAERLKTRLGWDLARAAIDKGLVPVALPVFQEEWVAWALTRGTGPLSASYGVVHDPARADFLRIRASMKVRRPWHSAEAADE